VKFAVSLQLYNSTFFTLLYFPKNDTLLKTDDVAGKIICAYFCAEWNFFCFSVTLQGRTDHETERLNGRQAQNRKRITEN